MNQQNAIYSAAGTFAITGGLFAVGGFGALQYFFGYPEIIRADPAVIMQRLHEMRQIVPYLYYIGVGGAGLCIFFFSILFGKILNSAGEQVWSVLGKTCGVVAGVLLYIGIIRYSFLFPTLAAMRQSGLYDTAAIDLTFKAMNTFIGESMAEHAQFTFSAFMFLFFGLSITKSKVLPKWIALFAISTTAVILVGNLEQFGFKFAFAFNRFAAKMLALWFVCAGVVLVYRGHRMQ